MIQTAHSRPDMNRYLSPASGSERTTAARTSARAPHALLPLVWLALGFFTACGADVESYEPSLTGIVNEGENNPNGDASFEEGDYYIRVADDACPDPTDPPSFFPISMAVANQFRNTTVTTGVVDIDCVERSGPAIAPGETVDVGVQPRDIVRIYNATTGELLSAWQITSLDPLNNSRVVLRSSDAEF